MKYDLIRSPSSNFRGVSWNLHASKYEARIAVAKVHYFLGLYEDDISAAIVYDAWAIRLGFPSRSNGAAERYAAELPNAFAPAGGETCRVCNGAKEIEATKRSNGEWVSDGFIPCPLCQNQSEIMS